MKQSILIVDDDRNVLEVLEARLSSAGFLVFKTAEPKDALDILTSNPVDLMISDMKMPGMSGMELFHDVRSMLPGLPVVFLTAYGSIPDAVNAVKAGAVDYIAKPFDGQELLKKLRKILLNTATRPGPGPKAAGSGMEEVVTSAVMRELYGLIDRVAVSPVNVLILGESGSGKEYIARMIHQKSPRREAPFVVVDCGSTPTGLLESELFGHTKGAFTHAIRDKKGLIEEADQGTLFLDEIGNVSPEMQVRLLRFLEDRKIRRIGEVREIPVNCRVIAATNADLMEDISSGRFREDLYYRLRVVTLRIPSLKDRKEDIPNLAKHFIESFCTQNELPLVELPMETTRWLCNYPWPGNVRELKNALEAGVVMCKNRVLLPEDLRTTGLPDIAASHQRQTVTSFSLEESERNAIIRALQQTGGVQKDAADLLGISRRAIHYKIKKFEIDAAAMKAGGARNVS
ncbi:MAG: sigma-54-dependent transcriptional regulator [Thermodesulfobacteriota bacterium]